MNNSEQVPFEPAAASQPESAPRPSETPGEELPTFELPARAPLPVEVFPAWSGWDVLAVAGSAVAAVFVCSVLALGIAHLATASRHVPVSTLATNTLVLIGGQIAAYPIVIFFMSAVVRAKSDEGFWQAIRWKWPGALSPA